MMKVIIAKTKCHVTTHDNPQKRVGVIFPCNIHSPLRISKF